MALTFDGRRRRPGGGPPATPLTPQEQSLIRQLLSTITNWSGLFEAEQIASAAQSLDYDRFENFLTEMTYENLKTGLDRTLQRVVIEGGSNEARRIIRETPRIQQSPWSRLDYDMVRLPNGILVPRTLPTVPDIEFVIEQPVERMFNQVSSRAVNYARTRSGQLITAIDESNRRAIRQVITRSFTEPMTVDDLALTLRRMIGLHPRWATAVERFHDTNLRRLINEGQPTATARQIADDMSLKYRSKLIRRRAEMIARTEIQQAQNFSREASWQAADRAGLIDPRAEKEWRTAPLGSRYGPPCPTCTALRGTRVPWNGVFDNGASMPPAHPNCRCTAVLVPPTRGLTGLPSQDMSDWIAAFDALEAEQLREIAANA